MIWKKVSLSKPVALAQEMTAEGVSHVSEKAVAGIQTASHSVQESWQRHKERKIFDVEQEKDALGEGIAGAATAVTAEGAAEDNGEGIETPSISSSSHVESERTDQVGAEDNDSFEDEYGTPCDEEESQGDVPVPDDEDVPAPEEDEVMPKAPGNGIVEHKIVTTDAPGAYTSVPPRDPSLPPVADIKPMEPELTAGTVEVGAKGQTAVPTAVGEKTYRLPSVSILHRGNPPEEGLSDEVRQNAQILQDTLKSFMIALYANHEKNPHNAQLLFTAHNTAILQPTQMRRDEIWLCCRQEGHDTELYPLSSYKKENGLIPYVTRHRPEANSEGGYLRMR